MIATVSRGVAQQARIPPPPLSQPKWAWLGTVQYKFVHTIAWPDKLSCYNVYKIYNQKY